MTNHSPELEIVFRAPDGTDFILPGRNKPSLASLPRQGETVTLLDGEDVLMDDGVVEDVKWMIDLHDRSSTVFVILAS